MCHRKRRIARPMLEPIESRVVPSAIGGPAHHVKAIAAHVGRAYNPVQQAVLFQRQNNQALKRLQQQENTVRIHARLRTPSALPTEAEKQISKVSNLFKEIGQSL